MKKNISKVKIRQIKLRKKLSLNIFGLKKFTAFVLTFLMVLMAASQAAYTLAVFNDTENSSDNFFNSAFLDFYLSENNFETFIGKEALGEYSVASAVVQTQGSLDVQYGVGIEKISGDDDFCNGLDLEATKNGIEVHDDDLFSFSNATSTEFGTWEFEFDLPPTATNVGQGDKCEFDIVYTGWRDGSTYEESGFNDEERIRFIMKSKMVVMNEVLPNPDGSDSQDGLLGEWVELYNNGDTSVDIAGWTISELTDPSGTPTENFYTIVATSTPSVGEVRTASGSTIIAPGGYSVILFEASRLNNTGDTVTLYDGSAEVMDSHTYVNGEAPEGKSIARIPDGIGTWVDPIPTPGGANIEEGDLLYSPLTLSSELDFGINENFAGHNAILTNWDEIDKTEDSPQETEESAQCSEDSAQCPGDNIQEIGDASTTSESIVEPEILGTSTPETIIEEVAGEPSVATTTEETIMPPVPDVVEEPSIPEEEPAVEVETPPDISEENPGGQEEPVVEPALEPEVVIEPEVVELPAPEPAIEPTVAPEPEPVVVEESGGE